ncbi:hypothetical protein B7H19_09330 [Pseudomonas putida]|uniref:hypothetical protein n=1 Tax=Pseudomonas putida TaxID=303 RepID=UPI000A0F8FFB|nr:hypothetical protein [Pseudomonas putida]ORL69685.1 hypothetical protein B7H19_09330 [Pseudomonas putida]
MDTNKMRDLKALAETCLQHQPLRFMRSHGALYIRNDNGIVFDVHQNRSFPDFISQNKDYADLALACTPPTILALLAEIERLAKFEDWFIRLDQVEQSLSASFKAERDQFRAENEDYRSGQDRYEQIIDDLKAENEALRREREGKVLCDLDLFETLRDSANTEADEHRQCMATYRPLRQEHLDAVVKECDDLIAAVAKEAANG